MSIATILIALVATGVMAATLAGKWHTARRDAR